MSKKQLEEIEKEIESIAYYDEHAIKVVNLDEVLNLLKKNFK